MAPFGSDLFRFSFRPGIWFVFGSARGSVCVSVSFGVRFEVGSGLRSFRNSVQRSVRDSSQHRVLLGSVRSDAALSGSVRG